MWTILRAEQSRAEQSRAEQSRAEQSRAEQSSDDSGGYHANRTFCAALILGLADSGRDHSGVVMLCQFPVGTVNLRRVPISHMVYTDLEIVRHQYDSGAAEILEQC